MALLPIIGGRDAAPPTWSLNGITLRPPTEIYPDSVAIARLYREPTGIAMRSTRAPGRWRLGRIAPTSQREETIRITRVYESTSTKLDNYCYVNGWMLANYLAGTNAAGKPVTWPAFPGPSGPLTGGFAGKYTPRQIDNIVAQIVSLGSRAISSDYPISIRDVLTS